MDCQDTSVCGTSKLISHNVTIFPSSDPKDPQAVESLSAYQSAKYCVGLVATRFNNYIQGVYPPAEDQEIKSILIHPGILAGNMFTEIIGYWLDLLMKLAFYLVSDLLDELGLSLR
jgi:hypothetical protein